MLVIDASALIHVIADGTAIGQQHRLRVSEEEHLSAPDLIRVECLSAIRRHHRLGELDAQQAEQAIQALLAMPITIYPAALLIRRAWELRDNVNPYDACYVALAELLGCPLLTGDARLARAPGATCEIELI